MIDLEKYFGKEFKPLDIIGTTSYGPIAREIWRNTWVEGSFWKWFSLYALRSMLSTHTAITCIGNDGRKWIIEMDGGKFRDRYISFDHKKLLAPEEYEKLDYSEMFDYQKIKVFSGVKLTKPEEYFTDNIRSPHVCFIGRFQWLGDDIITKGNEWLFDRYREGVPYDYADLLALWDFTKKLKILGSTNVYVCSELVQRCFEYMGVIQKQVAPMTPMDWQKNEFLKRIEG